MEASVEVSGEVSEEVSAWAHLKVRELIVVREVEWADKINIEKRLIIN